MVREFHSNFSDDFKKYIEFRTALSRNLRSALTLFSNLDKYILENWPNETELTEGIVLGWLTCHPGESVKTLNSRASFIRVFASYLRGLGRDAYVVPINYCSSGTRYTPYMFSDAELKELFRTVDTDSSVNQFVGCILSTVLRLIYTCGLRPGEALRILRDNVDLVTGEILLVKTKMHKERVVVASGDMRALLKRYTCIRDAAYPESEYLFPTPSGMPYSTHWLTFKFRNYFRSIHENVSVNDMPRARVYDLRHLFASQCLNKWLDEGVDLNVMLPYLSAFMGHGSIKETEYYIHILPENLISCKTIDFKAMEAIIPEVKHEIHI